MLKLSILKSMKKKRMAHLCQKAEKIEKKQEEIEMLLAKIVVDNNSKIKNEKEEK